jgi:hypothetical protein
MPRIGLLKALLAALACGALWAAQANEIEVREARLENTEEGLVLEADFAFELGPRLSEVVANGIPLYFLVEFDLSRARWWWFDEKAASKRMQIRLSYHALSRHYRLSTGLLQQNYATLAEALHVLKRVRNWLVLERTATLSDAIYDASVRMRLDATQLPKPFQLSALTSRDLTLESDWKRFAFRPVAVAAPVESREPKEAPSR